MPILPSRIHKNGGTFHVQRSPSDEAAVFIILIHAAAQFLPMECGHIFDGVLMERQGVHAAQPRHLSIRATPLNGQKQSENLGLQNLY